MAAGRRRWVEEMKARGERFPGGRKKGAAWVTPAMKQREREREREAERRRWAALSPQERAAERHAAITAGGVSAIDELIRRLERR
jgi:hypothetical protein